MTPPEPDIPIQQQLAFRPADYVDNTISKDAQGGRIPAQTAGKRNATAEATRPPLRDSTSAESTQQTPRDGSPAPSMGGGRFLREAHSQLSGGRSASQSPFRLQMPAVSPAQIAFSAMMYLPVPVMILNNLKTVVQANEAMARMLDMLPEDNDEDASVSVDKLRGQTLSQVGIDMLQDGRPVWLTWDTFFDSMVEEMGVRAANGGKTQPSPNTGDATPTAATGLESENAKSSVGTAKQDAIVEVVISRKDDSEPNAGPATRTKVNQINAKMIISIWEIDDRQPFFTLTFTSSQSEPSKLVQTRKSNASYTKLEAAERRTITNSNSSSMTSSRDSNSPSFHSPGIVSLSSSPFPPMGPPAVASQSSTPSLLQKMMLIKDALLDNTEMPILAMWKDGSAAFPNKAARRLFGDAGEGIPSTDGFGLLSKWDMWTEDFSRELEPDEFPISILLRTETPFSNIRVGTHDLEGNRIVFDVLGEAIRDETTGEFMAAVVTGRDVTTMTDEMTEIKGRDEEREERFRLICDTMPQMVWTATPEGYHDYFNNKWYEYTGLTEEESAGEGWVTPFHEDDLEAARPRWEHALKTGESYEVEYRCRSKTGEWRWFLGRAEAARNKETGEIEKWFGTCTDVHAGVEGKLEASRVREQLLSLLKHTKVTLFTVDTERAVTMLEGSLIWDKHESVDPRWFLGENMYTVFNRLAVKMSDGERPEFLQPIEDILDERINGGIREHQLDDQWYRTRFLPMERECPNGLKIIDGVIGLIMDVTEVRAREEELQKQDIERRKALANEAAAKEATRLKSQFLANMSHEIRTPITGVLGMAELLGATELDGNQRDFVDNIQSSATSLLTVINDILDFSKVESGRLDIEEVQFSLSMIVKEVGKMLRFAVERKNLDFQSDIGKDIKNDMVVIGDPGRVRQIITNLLTNSIKFTNQGHVRFSVAKERETSDSVEVRFTVEDTGIGIQEDVRKRLFQPFSQGDASTARRFGGTGLGLTICKNLLDLMHGRITLKSTLGKGTTATFWIPFHKSSSPQNGGKSLQQQAGFGVPDRLQSELSLSCNSSEHEHGSLPSPGAADGILAATGGLRSKQALKKQGQQQQGDKLDMSPDERAKINVLVVEDNPINQKYAIFAITKMGFQVKAVWNGKEALEYLTTVLEGKASKPDIILMDVQMPIIDGYKCTHLLRHHMPYKTLVEDVAIVAMTASAIQGDREKAFKAGMDDYVSKPVNRAIIELMITRWTGNRRRSEGGEERPQSKALSGGGSEECSEIGEHCGNADIPQVGITEDDFWGDNTDESKGGKEGGNGKDGGGGGGGDKRNNGFDDDEDDDEDYHASPITPRPLTTNNLNEEKSPFEAAAAEAAKEGEREWSSKLQENKMLDAAGGMRAVRKGGEVKGAGEALTEENVRRLRRGGGGTVNGSD